MAALAPSLLSTGLDNLSKALVFLWKYGSRVYHARDQQKAMKDKLARKSKEIARKKEGINLAHLLHENDRKDLEKEFCNVENELKDVIAQNEKKVTGFRRLTWPSRQTSLEERVLTLDRDVEDIMKDAKL